jgi:5-methylcytosine-specific restriction endonuclease McrA
LDAAESAEAHPAFWSYGQELSLGAVEGVWLTMGRLSETATDHTFVCGVKAGESFPSFFERMATKRLFQRASCAKCQRPMTGLSQQAFREYEAGRPKRKQFLVCTCGYPVWHLDEKELFDAWHALANAARYWARQRLPLAEGSHTPEELEDILRLQGGRCIYCNSRLGQKIPPTRDHLLALAHGGSDWAINIVMACGSCNSRRCDIPFRTFCLLLSAKQNQRILTHLAKRLMALNRAGITKEALRSFDKGLALASAAHWRFNNIQAFNAVARRNVAQNELLPRTRGLILRAYRDL